MTYKLRPYQEEAVSISLDYLTKPNAQPFIIQAATGAGKSLMIAETCHRLNEPVLILQPSKELLEQNYAKLISYHRLDPALEVGIYSASKGLKQVKRFTYATIGSIYKKPELFKHFKYVIIDECHNVNPKKLDGMYKSFLDAIGCQRVCGLTATPYRIVQKFVTYEGELYYTATTKMINRISKTPFFKSMPYKIETQDLIDMGYLSPIKYHNDGAALDSLEVNSTGADFTPESLERFWTDARMERMAKIIQLIDEKAKCNLIFCSSIRQAMKTQAMLEAMGIKAEVVTGETPTKEREAIIESFRRGRLKHLINVGVFTTGFDVPELNSIVLARPTMSLALYYQMVGRGVRLDPADPNKVLRVFDLAGIVDRLGRVETIRLKKEQGYKDMIVSEVGRMDERALFSFKTKPKART